MKKILVSMLTAMLLLPGMSVFAQNVARVGTTEYATIAEAIDAWKTNGGTLTLLGDCTYDAMTIIAIAKDAVLDLNGKALTWNTSAEDAIDVNDGVNFTIQGDATAKGTISFVSTYAGSSPFMIYAGATKNPSKLCVQNVIIKADFTESDGYVVASKSKASKTSFVVENTEIIVENKVCYVFRLGYPASNDFSSTFSNVSIKGIGVLTNIRAFESYQSCTLDNCRIDFSQIASDKQCYGLYADGSSSLVSTIKGSNTCFILNNNKNSGAVGLSSSGATVNVDEGIFSAPNFIYFGGKFNSKYPTINIGGLSMFNTLPPYVLSLYGKSFAKVGGDGEYKDYYKIMDKATYKFVNNETYVPYETAEECFADCVSSSNSVTILTSATEQNDFQIPANTNVTLKEVGANSYKGTITNHGTLTLFTTYSWDNFSIVNYGVLNLNNGTHYGDNFVLDNKNGTVSVTNGYFTARSIEQVRSYIVPGYVEAVQENGEIRIIADVVYKVGTKSYADIKEALAASSEAKPAVLQKDYTYATITIHGNAKKAFLDLNGHQLTLTQSGSKISNTNLTISNGTIIGTENIDAGIFEMIGSSESTATEYSVLTINKDVTIKQVGHKEGNNEYVVWVDSYLHATPYGIVVNFNGTYEGTCPFYIHGGIVQQGDNMPTFNIGKDAKFTCSEALAYASGYGIWNYEGTATTENFGFEIRAGKFTMNGGSITCTADKPADDQYNGNGSTSQACGIAVCQHNTKLPIEVVVNDGEIKAYTPLYQANPQNNETEMSAINVTVNGGKFFSTSKNIIWSLNRRITLNGGVYNLAPTAYAAEGKTVVANTDPDTKDMYPYTIGEVAQDITFATAGTWNTASNWSTGAVATSAVPVKIAADVTIPAGTMAEAYGITVEAGKVITIEDGGVLMVGKNGIAGITTPDQLIIKDGGALLISPVAEASVAHPQCTNELKTTVRDAKEDYKNQDATYEYIWKNIASPVQKDGMAFTPQGQSAVNIWNNGWEYITSAAEFGVPFTGYHITVHPSVAATVTSPTYEFTGNSNGNDDITLTMNREGFHLFGNSWSAPLDVREILNQIEHFTDSKVNTSIKVYISDKCTLGGDIYFDGQYVDITRAKLSSDATFAEAFSTLGAHECFFLCSNASSSQVSLNYEKAVWNAMLSSAKSSAPRRMLSAEEPTYTTRVVINLMAENERNDDIMLLNDNREWSKKLMNEGPANVNIYVATAENNYSQVSAEDLTGTELTISTNKCERYTLSFSSVMGEPLYIKDMQTGVVTEMSEGNTYAFTAVPYTTSTRFRIVSRSEVTTGMDTVVPVAGKSGVYTLMGQYLGETSVWETLPAGVYIVNGTKVVK